MKRIVLTCLAVLSTSFFVFIVLLFALPQPNHRFSVAHFRCHGHRGSVGLRIYVGASLFLRDSGAKLSGEIIPRTTPNRPY